MVGLVLLLREIFHTYVEHSSTPSLTYNTILAIFMIGSFVTHLTRILEVNNLRNRIIEKAEFLDLSSLNFLTTTMMVCYGMSTFLLIMRSILILKFFRLINIFHSVLFIALKNVLHFAIYIILTILIFALTGMILFGSRVILFSSFTKSIMSLLAVLTRNMEYVQFQEAAPFVAPIYFIIFYGVTYCVLSRIVAAIFIRTMFELRRGKADQAQEELANFLWIKFQEWLWEEEDEQKKRKKKTPNYDVVSTKVEEMEAFVNALLRTVESSINRRGGGGGDGPAPGSGRGPQSPTRPDSSTSSVFEPSSRPNSVPRTAGSSSGKRVPILKSSQASTRPKKKGLINKSVRIDEFSQLEDYNPPPFSPKKDLPNSPKSSEGPLSPRRPTRPLDEPTFSFITPMRPISPQKSAIPTIELPTPPLKNGFEPEHQDNAFSPESPDISTSSTLSNNRLSSLPIKSLPTKKDFPDTIRMMTLPLSPPNVPRHMQPIINKRAELPPLQTTTTSKKS